MTTVTYPAITPATAFGLCAVVDSNANYPAGWQACSSWGSSVEKDGIYAIVAQNKSTEQLAIAIQGTQNALDFLKDFHVIPQVQFEPISGAAIASGSNHGLNALLAMTNNSGETLQSFLESLNSGTYLLVTGHSLGGNLASVLTPWIAANISAFGGGGSISSLPANLNAITFAAPTAGNAAFASFLNNNSANYQAYFNTNDVIPYAWATSGEWNVSNVDNLFPSPGPNPAPSNIQGIISEKISMMKLAKVSYTQTNGNTFSFAPIAASGSDPWIWEMEYQHNYAYCTQFLGPNAGCTTPT